MQCCGRGSDPHGWVVAAATQASDEGCRPRDMGKACARLRPLGPPEDVGTCPPAQVGLHGGVRRMGRAVASPRLRCVFARPRPTAALYSAEPAGPQPPQGSHRELTRPGPRTWRLAAVRSCWQHCAGYRLGRFLDSATTRGLPPGTTWPTPRSDNRYRCLTMRPSVRIDSAYR